jgi:hypothetical protein
LFVLGGIGGDDGFAEVGVGFGPGGAVGDDGEGAGGVEFGYHWGRMLTLLRPKSSLEHDQGGLGSWKPLKEVLRYRFGLVSKGSDAWRTSTDIANLLTKGFGRKRYAYGAREVERARGINGCEAGVAAAGGEDVRVCARGKLGEAAEDVVADASVVSQNTVSARRRFRRGRG